MANKVDGHSFSLKKSRLALVVMFSTLLLASMLFNVVRTSGVDASSWSGEGNIANEADVFFDDSYIHEIRLYFDDPNWYDTLYDAHDNNRTTSDPYFPARFVSHGIELDPVGVRFKGLSTFGFGGGFFFGPPGGGEDEDIKKPFRIDFNLYDEEGAEETTFFGLKKLNLNNGALDPSMIREKLFMDFASNYVPAPRSVFTRLYVNDEYYGLYLAMEHIDNTFVESRFGDDESGNLYKVEQQGTLSYLGQDPEEYNGRYELKNNEDINDWSDLIWLTNVLTNTPISELPNTLESIFDVESAMYSIALLDLFVSGDSYIGNARNYYLYHRSDTGQFTHLLWDANLVFGNFGFGMGMGSGADPTEYGVFPPSTMAGFGFGGGGGGGFFGPPGGGEQPDNSLMLIKRVMAVESYNRTYLRALAQMIREGFDADSINSRIQELANLIRNEIYNDPNLWTNPEDFEPELEAIVDFVEKRAAYVDTQLNAYAKKTDLQLNDLMTVNQGTIVDNQGDYDPWVEIYNVGPGLLNTSNMFLTDNPDVPNKWKLPTQNLDDGEFLLLWLDSEPSEGANHAPFNLNSGGGNLYLYMYNGSSYVVVDSISYPALDADVSFGRFPNGEGLWQIMSEVVTPAQLNQQVGIPDGLVINEFMANNDAAVAGPNNDYPDWIEIYNGGTESVDLGGLYLSDDSTNPKWQFPDGTVIDAGSFLVFWCENSSVPRPGYVNFNLNAQGEFICLLAEDGETLIDSIAFGEQFDDISYGRVSDGSSTWDYLTPTPNSSNALGEPVDPNQPVQVPEHLYINEFMANNDAAVAGPNDDYPDWIELYNGGSESVDLSGMYLSDNLLNPDVWQFPSGTVIDAGGFLVVWADGSPDRGPLHASFGLNTTGESVCLFAGDGATLVDSIDFGEQFDDVSYGRLVDGGSNWGYLTATAGSSNALAEPVDPSQPVVEVPEHLFINEFMANNDVAVAGPNDDYPDWIELYNGGTEAIDIGGMYLTDDLGDPDTWQFPSDTIIESGGYLIIWADNLPERGLLHASFGLNASGEAIGLFATDGETEIDSVMFEEQLDDVSYGRLPDGFANWTYLTPTPGSQNEEGDVINEPTQPVAEIPEGLVINEFMADNGVTIAGPDGNNPDWIELYNGGNESVILDGMYLTDNLRNPTKWQFPDDTVIEAGGFLLIWADNASDSDGLHASFGLRANGEEIALFASDGATLIDSITYTKQLQDVSYGRVPDGADNWEYLLSATPGWGNNSKQPFDAGSSFSMILILVGVVGLVTVLFVAITKYSEKRE
jgi:spore coat protein CotH